MATKNGKAKATNTMKKAADEDADALRIVVGLRVTAEEKAALRAAAGREGRPLAQWARRALLAAAEESVPTRK